MVETLLHIKEISKTFGNQPVFERLSLDIHRGEIFGLLGLNGVGKTTLFKCILKFIGLSAGEILYQGKRLDFPVIHEKIGYLPEFFLPPAEFTAKEYLNLLQIAVTGSRLSVEMLLEKTGLDPNKKIHEYSRGMIQRLGLAIALLKDPEFLMLDEPTLGLDPLARQKLLSWLQELNQRGKTILLSSHDFLQVEKLCHRVAVLHQGAIQFTGCIADYVQKQGSTSLEEGFLKEVGFNHA